MSKDNNAMKNQLSLFENYIENEQNNSETLMHEDNELNDFLENFDESEYSNEESSNRQIEPQQRELLTLKLLRKAIQDSNQDDPVMTDFAEIVLPNLLKVAIGVTAKGGKFFDEIDAKNVAEGKAKVRRDNAADQSLNTHLLNGLFPANQIKKRLQIEQKRGNLDTTIGLYIEEFERRLTIAGFILHDYEKFKDIREKYKLDENPFREFSLEEEREIISDKLDELELKKFISPKGDENVFEYIDDLLALVRNTQRMRGTNWNFSEFSLQPKINTKLLRQMVDLCCLADSFASIIKHPQDATKTKFKDLMHNLSDGQLSLTYHHLAENRGVLTNVVNNAVMDLYKSLNTDTETYYEPLLYLPTGVIYIKTRNAPDIPTEGLGDRVIEKIKSLCSEQITNRNIGISRGNLLITFAPFCQWIFSCREFIKNAPRIVVAEIRNSKSVDKLEKAYEFVNKNSNNYVVSEFQGDVRVDQLALFIKLIASIWDSYVSTRKQKEKLGDSARIFDCIIEACDLSDLKNDLELINREKGNNANPFEWFFFADQYIKKNPGIENMQTTLEAISNNIIQNFTNELNELEKESHLTEINSWVNSIVQVPSLNKPKSPKKFLEELKNYQAAKKRGGKVCSLGGGIESLMEQSKDSVLFMPQQFSNRLPLLKKEPKRSISKVMAIEIMLRKCLMSNVNATGADFEDRKYRYLYFYPTYYFTPETNKFLQQAYQAIAQTRFDTELRNHFISKKGKINLTKENYQSVDFLLMDEDIQSKQKLPDDDPNYKKDRTFKLSYPDDQHLTFYFMALPPEIRYEKGKPKVCETESWVMPTWLAFVMPMILDVKTVVSESPIPPFTHGTEFEETVFLDSAPQAFRVLTGIDRFRLDYILEGWRDKNTDKAYPSPLKTLTAAYAIHLDINRKKDGNPNWGKLMELAKDFQSSPLHVFSYLSKWRRGKEAESPPISKIRLYTEHFYPCFDPYVKFENNQFQLEQESPMNYPQNLTKLYRNFYRAKDPYKPKANAILKPIDEAATVILNADNCLTEIETLVYLVAARINKLMDRVHSKNAEGRWVISDREVERQKILEFAQYFVIDVFQGGFKGDRARLAGKQINLIRDTCEFLYRLEQDQENQDYKAQKEAQEEV